MGKLELCCIKVNEKRKTRKSSEPELPKHGEGEAGPADTLTLESQNCKDANFLVLQPQACIWLSLQLWQTKARRQLMIMRMEITMGFKVLTGVGSREKKGRGAGMDRGYMVKSFRKFLYVKKERNMPNTEKQMA